MYNWQLKDWPNFRYSTEGIEDKLFEFSQRAGHINGLLEGLSDSMQMEAVISIMVCEAIKTSEIEGEYLSREDVMSSIRNNLGYGQPRAVKDPMARGAGELMAKVREGFADPLKQQTLFDWHSILLASARRINIGQWRTHTEPMQIVSGAWGREKVHFEAPASSFVPKEMKAFIEWFNESHPEGAQPIKKPIIRSAIAHLYFETIHPFEDGNGRIGRAISEKALSQDVNRPILLSLSRAIDDNKKTYYDALKSAQRSNEITEWIEYFVETVLKAQLQAEALISFTLKKAKFFDQYGTSLNDRQLKVINKILDKGIEGFEGGMTAKKYIAITKTSKATATRDLQDLAARKIFKPLGEGRSTRYEINLEA
ncbi:MAG: Fic family protein [Leeuwenhoekiella sp.]